MTSRESSDKFLTRQTPGGIGGNTSKASMNEFEKYRRIQIAEMRPVTELDVKSYEIDKEIHSIRDTEFKVSISDVDRKNGSPKIGDMIARNPNNHNDQWLVAEKYFNENFATIK